MKKNRVFILGVLAIALTFSAVQRTEAQDRRTNDSEFFETVEDRDTYMLARMERMPYYIIMYGIPLTSKYSNVPRSILLQDVMYQWDDGNIVALFNRRHMSIGDTVAGIVFFSTLKEAEENKKLINGTILHALGPFEAGSTNASRRASLQRIIDALASWGIDGNIPQTW